MRPFFKNHPYIGRVVVLLVLLSSPITFPLTYIVQAFPEFWRDAKHAACEMARYVIKGRL